MKQMLLQSTALLAAVSIPLPALAEGATAVYVHYHPLQAAFAMYSDDADTGSDIGCFEQLVNVSPDLKLVPSLATEWKPVSPVIWEFTVREGVLFQDGTPLTAEVAAGALNNLLDAPVPTRAFSKANIAKVEATGPLTLQITTTSPDVMLPGRMTGATTSILSPAAYAGETLNPIGTCTGPFQITSFDAAVGVKAVAFPGYWGGAPALAGVETRFIPDSNTRTAMIRSGEASLAVLVAPTQVTLLKSQPEIVVHETLAPRVTELLLNNSRPPFDDLRVRQAVKAVIDTAGISAAVYEGYSPAAASPFRVGEPWVPQDAPVVTPDVEKAKALLQEAGVDPASLKLVLKVYNSKTELRLVAEIIQAQLAEIGISVEIELADYGVIEPELLAGNFDMAMMSRGYLADVPEPIGFLAADYGCEGGFNISHFCDKAFDAKLTAISAETDPAKRYAVYAELAQFIYDNALSIFIVNETTFNARSAKLEGYVPHPLDTYPFTPTTTLN